MTTALVAPFPYFGGKRRVAREVWRRFGDVACYVEPFAGSAAVLLQRPGSHAARVETVNDADGLLSNFWRAVKLDPAAVADAADWPNNENDLHARHAWLVGQRASITARLEGDPDWCDAKAAGWWVWGACNWIGSGWCSGRGPWGVVVDDDGASQLLHLGNAGQGINRKLLHLGDAGQGINRKLLHLGDAGQGINRKLLHLGDAGQGINRKLLHLGDAGQGINRKLLHLGDAGQGINRKLLHLGDAGRGEIIRAWMDALAVRLRDVRVASGDWARIVTPSTLHPTARDGSADVTGVFLDPPYAAGEWTPGLYSVEHDVSADVREWSVANGDNPRLRIALCGYDSLAMPDGWTAHPWKAHGGYGGGRGNRADKNSAREVVWFSRHCLAGRTVHAQPALFGAEVAHA